MKNLIVKNVQQLIIFIPGNNTQLPNEKKNSIVNVEEKNNTNQYTEEMKMLHETTVVYYANIFEREN